MTMTMSTSMNGTRLISGSSLNDPRRKFIAAASGLALAADDLDQLDRLDFHFHDQRIGARAEVAVEDEARHGDDDAERGVVQRDRDAVRELRGIRHAGRSLRAEDLDHADDRAEQAEQRRHGGD